MIDSGLLRKLRKRASLTFRRSRWLLVGLLILCAVPGLLLAWMPVTIRHIYGYVLLAFASIALSSAVVPFVNIAWALPRMLLNRHWQHECYEPPELQGIVRTMGLKGAPRVLLVTNPLVTTPFTNALTRTIRLPKSWLAKLSPRELLSTLAHELGHVRGGRRFLLEMLGAFGIVLVAATPLAYLTASIIAQIFEVALLFLLIPWVSWRNEYRADLESAKALGPEGLISVLEQLEAESEGDEGSETHPPLKDRIERLTKLLGPW